jgi:signal transduction histidine kinase
MSGSLESVAAQLAANPEVTEAIGRPSELARLFEMVRSPLTAPGSADLSVTIYDGSGSARAWAGRPSEIPRDRILDGETFFVAPGPLGLRLVYVRPLRIQQEQNATGQRVGSIAVERVLSPASGLGAPPVETYSLQAPISDVVLRTVYEGAGTGSGPNAFSLRSPEGEMLLEAEVVEAALVEARQAWRRTTRALLLALLAFALVSACVPPAPTPKDGPSRSILTQALVGVAGGVAGYALLRLVVGLGIANGGLGTFDPAIHQSIRMPTLIRAPADVLLLGLFLVGLVLVAAFAIDQSRIARHSGRRVVTRPLSLGLVAAGAAAGTAVALVLLGLDRLVSDTFDGAAPDLLYTSLQAWDSGRLAILVGLLLLSAAALWGGASIFIASRLPWQIPRRDPVLTLVAAAAWTIPGLLLVTAGLVPPLPFFAMLGGSVVAAVLVPYLRPRFRHASHAARVLTLFLALLAPALLVYPSLLHHGEQTKRRLVEGYALQAEQHPQDLQARLEDVLRQIDALEGLEAITSVAGPFPGTIDTDRAFFVWRQTDLASLRLTSAVGLYGSDGGLISRFALNFPEYVGLQAERQASGCEWEVYAHIAPFGFDERNVLHAERSICPRGEVGLDTRALSDTAGSVVVHIVSDYQALPFIPSGNPYIELLRPAGFREPEGRAGRDVEFAVYGWGLQRLFSSGPDAWSLSDPLFERIFASREAFWTTLTRAGRDYSTYVANNRAGIYLVGYPISSMFDHLVHLAEVATLSALVFALLALLSGVGSWLMPDRRRFGRALIREVRTSFYRRLFLAFIAAALVPVLALAFVIRGYFIAELRADVEDGAARTAAVAQRVIEESFVFQQIGAEATALINDDLLIWISQVLDQDVNIFDGSQLLATSERDLFASGLLPTRTPDAAYSAIALQRLPSFVMEDTLGTLDYLVAATPIRAAGADAILTVPLASRQQEIEDQIDDLDRGILLGVAIFIILAAGGGLYMAERIADPVKRLTRATGKIARGDFDAQVMVRSADELQRLVASFNQMALDLKDQQAQLEKTHRLEAWADMARQVAHEIKNPLTPVQLSAEHLLRVHADRGEPLGPVLENCVESILAQVRLLRQISSEFSSYASSPVVQLRPTSLHDLVNTVLDPYLVGLAGRIEVLVDIPNTLPELVLDRTLVGRAVTNVVENALHAMPGSGSLTIRATATDSEVVLTVIDSGVGLDADTLERIYEPYFSTKVSGTGLGMAIAKRNVELSGGAIDVQSREGHGTTVTFTFRHGS